MAGYLKFADDMVIWYDKIIDYAKNKRSHENLKIDIDPLPEVNKVKISAYAQDVAVMQNAAEEQIAVYRAMRERDRTASFYFASWLQFIEWEKKQITKFKPLVEERHPFIATNSKETQLFYRQMNPVGVEHLDRYDPWLGINETPDEL